VVLALLTAVFFSISSLHSLGSAHEIEEKGLLVFYFKTAIFNFYTLGEELYLS
jgi:hypothetical protein